MTDPDEPFLSRWARRKAQVRSGVDIPAEVPVRAVAPADATTADEAAPVVSAEPAPAPEAEPVALPTMEDVALLTRQSDFSAFVRPGVDPAVSNAAMKKLFSDPRYNVMDGLDTYIGDYNTPDPLPVSMLRKMNHAAYLGLLDEAGADAADPHRKPVAQTVVAAATIPEAPTAARGTQAAVAAAVAPGAKLETGAPAEVPEGRADEDPDL